MFLVDDDDVSFSAGPKSRMISKLFMSRTIRVGTAVASRLIVVPSSAQANHYLHPNQ
jgi:hypothetical protein